MSESPICVFLFSTEHTLRFFEVKPLASGLFLLRCRDLSSFLVLGCCLCCCSLSLRKHFLSFFQLGSPSLGKLLLFFGLVSRLLQ